MEEPIRIGISACLLGKRVRFDGGHKHDRFVTGSLGRWVEFVPFCPEIEVGMGVPREAVRLVQVGDGVRMLGVRSREDWTGRMRALSRKRVAGFGDLCGVILKKDSPSCGRFRVRVYPERGGVPRRDGVGLFAQELVRAHPLLPVEEEGRLHDAKLREAFVERVFAYRRLRSLLEGRFTAARLQAFHAAHKYQLLAHAPDAYAALGRLVAAASELPAAEVKRKYAEGFMRAMAQHATPSRNANVLQHLLGHFKKRLKHEDKEEALSLIEDYRKGLVPLVVPLTLIAHFVRLYGDEWLKGQTYLSPHPKELMLRNHV